MNGIVSILFTFAQWTHVVEERTVTYIKIGLQAECGACTASDAVNCVPHKGVFLSKQTARAGRPQRIAHVAHAAQQWRRLR
jgi:hypothetical protein